MTFLKRLSILLLGLSILFSGSAFATDAWYADDSAPQGKVGLVWVEDTTRGESLSFLQNAPSIVCSTLADSKCRDGNWNTQIILPPCSEKITSVCVEGIQVGTDPMKLTSGSLVREVDAPHLPAYPQLNIPLGGSPSVWNVPGEEHTGGNSNYAVIASLNYTKGAGLIGFQAGIVPIKERNGPEYRKMQLINVPGTNDLAFEFHIGDCVFQEIGNCAVAQMWQKDAIASLSLRVPEDVTGWLYGRLSEPSISVSTSIGSEGNLLTVTGKPVTVEGRKPLVDFPNLPPKLENFLSDGGLHPLQKSGNYSAGGYVWQIPTDTPNFNWYDMWFPYTGDKADGLVDFWNIKSISNNFTSPAAQKCLKSKTNLVGLVTSNSLWYTGTPPEFDGTSLNYKVAALHFEPDGVTPFLGTYDLVMRDSAASCLYGANTLPTSAKVEILYATGASTVSTNTLVHRNGWLRLSVNGFTYSSPTIKVNLSPNSGAKSSNTAKDSGVKKKTISCVKGKLTKKITAANPTCPKGFKKS